MFERAMRATRRRRSVLVIGGGCLSVACAGLSAALLTLLGAGGLPADQCGAPVASSQVALGPPGTGELVGATEYGGPGDPSSGTVGASGASLLLHPDSYAELGGDTFQTATAMGGLPYMTPLRITWGGHSAIAYKRDFGRGGGPIGGLPRVIDLWWQFAGGLGIPYQGGMWSGPVRVGRAPPSGAANLLGQSTEGVSSVAGCAIATATGSPLTSGQRAQLLPSGLAAAPADAPSAVKGLIAAGNQIVGKPYLYGGAHGLPLSELAPAYDCSSSVEHLLYGGGLLPVTFDAPSGSLETFGEPGPGAWVTLYANPDHVFIYVAGLRWDTHDAAGPGDGSSGIGWHPLIRSSAGFVARHPVGL
jgi:cell wall-associated NlpC family hydrolase